MQLDCIFLKNKDDEESLKKKKMTTRTYSCSLQVKGTNIENGFVNFNGLTALLDKRWREGRAVVLAGL